MKKRCVIVGGADINNYDFIREKLFADDFMIFCDSGLKHLDNLRIAPNLIVGDFDSHENPHLDIETIVLPCEKDDTDGLLFVADENRRLILFRSPLMQLGYPVGHYRSSCQPSAGR